MLSVAFGAMKFIKLSKEKEDFVRFFYYLSFPTIFFGLIYGSFFGDAVKIPGIIDTSRDINSILAISIVLGVIQIFFGLGIKAYTLIKAGKKKDAFYDVGSWVITLVSAGMLGGSIALGWPSVVKYISIGGLIFGSIVIVLTGGRAEKTKGAQIGQGLYALYGITSYVGDLVSYTRLMALGLAGGSIAGALNLLINQLPGVAAVVVAPILFVTENVADESLCASNDVVTVTLPFPSPTTL
jgi:V/A-type H+-transporting ATPase subunit I